MNHPIEDGISGTGFKFLPSTVNIMSEKDKMTPSVKNRAHGGTKRMSEIVTVDSRNQLVPLLESSMSPTKGKPYRNNRNHQDHPTTNLSSWPGQQAGQSTPGLFVSSRHPRYEPRLSNN